jgi:hypothetical protein
MTRQGAVQDIRKQSESIGANRNARKMNQKGKAYSDTQPNAGQESGPIQNIPCPQPWRLPIHAKSCSFGIKALLKKADSLTDSDYPNLV